MHIKDHSAAMKFFRTYDSAASKGKWKEFVDEMEFDSMAQEPRTMAQEPRNMYSQGQLVRNTVDGSRPGYGGPGSGGARPHTGGDRSMYIDYTKMIKEPTANQLKIAEKAYSKQFNNLKGMDLWKEIGTTKRSNIVQKHITGGTSGVPGGKLKKNQLGKDDFIKLVNANKDKTYNEFVELIEKYKTKDGQPFTKQIVANRLRDYNLSGSFQKEPPKGDSPEAKILAEKKRKIRLKGTAPGKYTGTREFPFHHIMQIGGDVPLTTDDIAIIEQRMNSKLSKYNKPLNNIADAISKNHKLALEAMNAKNEGLALDYMKRVNQLNESAEKIVNKAIKELPKSYRNLIGFNQFTLPTNEYGLPIQNEPLLVKKIGGAPVTEGAIPLTDLTLDQEKALRAQIKKDATAGKINLENVKKFLKQADFNIDKCLSEGGRVKLKLGKGVNKCIQGVIDEELKLARKSGNTAKFTRFGKLARGAGYLVGWVDIPIELAFALPHLLAGNVQDAKAATTFGFFGYGGKKLEQIDPEKNPEAYKYFKHVQDINNWMDAFNQQQDAQSKWDNVGEEYLKKYQKEGDPSGVMDRIVDQYDGAVATQNYIQENYKGYVNEEGEEDLRLLDLGKEEGKKYLREIIEEEWKEGMPIRREPFSDEPYHWAPYKEDKITSLEQQIKQKGESFYGGFMKPGVKAAAERLGAPDLYDDWYDAYYGKDPREAYSSLPLEWTGQLAELEKKELYQALADKLMRPGGAKLKKSLIEQGFDFEPFRKYNLQTTGSWRMSEGGIASLMKKKW
jgi:hypothetical protein